MVEFAAGHVHWPAEWEPHACTWIAWPHQRDDWPGKFAPIAWVYAEIVRHLHRSEPVGILVNDAPARDEARVVLIQSGIDLSRVSFHIVPTDRVWTRDSGPTFVQRASGGMVALDWHFNGWAKYPNHLDDDLVPQRLAQELGWERARPSRGGRRIVLEGGSIDGNGAGVLLTTEECLLSTIQERNPGFTAKDYEGVFAEYLGTRRVIWLNQGIAGDDTHGHIDDLARFVAPRTIVAVVEDDPSDANYLPLRENLERLQDARDADGQRIEVVPLPMPDPVYFGGQRLPASYANFYIANNCVLVPTFNDPHDRVALGILTELMPDRTVIGIHAVDLVWGLGTLHCLTQQQPA